MRALLIILDSLGVGAAPDAHEYGDTGADTLGHLLERFPDLPLPAMRSLGLGLVLGDGSADEPRASWGRMRERSAGKDSTTGHWEIAGALLAEPFGVFERFPPELVHAIERDARVEFIGNRAASGTAILGELGPEHVRTGRPILYTSADSVLQIAAHESVIPVPRLYEICCAARRHADGYRIGRVIARPFTGEAGSYTRTGARHDFSMRPPRTVLDAIRQAGLPVKAIGKTADLFDGRGVSESHPTASNAEGVAAIERVWAETDEGLVFANLVDFDTVYGHRRDPAGYADALAEFDRWLDPFLARIRGDDLLIITADHGNDPTFRGTDHTREEVPLLVVHEDRRDDLGLRTSFADIAASLAAYFGLPEPWPVGELFIGRRARDARANAPGESVPSGARPTP